MGLHRPRVATDAARSRAIPAARALARPPRARSRRGRGERCRRRHHARRCSWRPRSSAPRSKGRARHRPAGAARSSRCSSRSNSRAVARAAQGHGTLDGPSRTSEVPLSTVCDDADIHSWRTRSDYMLRLMRALIGAWRTEPALNAWYDPASDSRIPARAHRSGDRGRLRPRDYSCRWCATSRRCPPRGCVPPSPSARRPPHERAPRTGRLPAALP